MRVRAVERAWLATVRRVKLALHDVTRNRWFLAKAYGRLRAQVKLRQRPAPILVYQMGKVASETVARSLRADDELAARGVAHVHFFAEGTLRSEEEALRAQRRRDVRAGRHIWESRALRPKLGSRKWDVVTLVRDPVARNLSSFFHTADPSYGVDLSQPPSVEALAELFYERFDTHDAPLTWFDTELRPTFGIDVYAQPFEASAGLCRYESEAARVLLLRVEDLERVGQQALGDFFGRPALALTAKNVGEGKQYGEVYRRFRQEVPIRDDYLDRMYGSRYARHFYTAEELDAFRRRWASPSPAFR